MSRGFLQRSCWCCKTRTTTTAPGILISACSAPSGRGLLSPWSPAAAPQLLLQYSDPASLLASSSRDQQTLRMITDLMQQQLLLSQFFCYNYFKCTAKCRRGIKAVRRCAAGNPSTTSCSYTISWTLESRTTIYPPKLQDNTGEYPACCKFAETLEISDSTTLTIAAGAAILANPWHQNY